MVYMASCAFLRQKYVNKIVLDKHQKSGIDEMLLILLKQFNGQIYMYIDKAPYIYIYIYIYSYKTHTHTHRFIKLVAFLS